MLRARHHTLRGSTHVRRRGRTVAGRPELGGRSRGPGAPDREAFLRHGDRSLARRAVDDTAAYLILCAALVFTTPILRDHTLLAVGTILGFAAIGGARFVLSRSFERIYDRAPEQWRRTFGVTTLGLAGLWALFSYSIAA